MRVKKHGLTGLTSQKTWTLSWTLQLLIWTSS